MDAFANDHAFAPWNRWPGEGPWKDPTWRDDPDAPWNNPDAIPLEPYIERWNDLHPNARIPADGLGLDIKPSELNYDLHFRPQTYWPRDHSMTGGELSANAPTGDEVEIVHIELASVNLDVIQVLARRVGTAAEKMAVSRIAYRVVDDYWDEGSRYQVSPAEFEQPLTLAELIRLIDTARQVDEGHIYGDDRFDVGLVESVWDHLYYVGEANPDDVVGFVSVTSPFYADLAAYYEDRAEAWCRKVGWPH